MLDKLKRVNLNQKLFSPWRVDSRLLRLLEFSSKLKVHFFLLKFVEKLTVNLSGEHEISNPQPLNKVYTNNLEYIGSLTESKFE